jgi:peptidoglycan DL-endopeptidase CwlO
MDCMIKYFNLIKQKSKSLTHRTQQILAFIALVGLTSGGALTAKVHADQFDQQIQALQAQNNSLAAQSQALASQAVSFETTIANLQNQITTLETQIQINETKRQQLEVKIAETQAKINEQKKILGDNIHAMYVEGDISTFEMLASSKDLSNFVDKQQYRNEVKDKITGILNTINALKKQLDSQKAEVDKIIADQRAIQSQLDAQRAEQARLLAMNEAQRAQLGSQMQANSSKMSSLRSQQAAANARLFGMGVRNVADGSGYPYRNAPWPNEISDPWGMYMRQCVSYTAWKVAATGRHMPFWGGIGNANQWDDNARRAGIPTDGSPRVGDVAISNSGYYGHAMYVEAVYGDGTIYVSQYNAAWTGTYSEARISIGSLVFIHF